MRLYYAWTLTIFCLTSTLASASLVDDGFKVVTDAQSINSALLQSNGQILIAGDFSIVDGKPHSHVARLNSDGNVDNSFDFSLDKPLAYLRIQTDNKLVGVLRTDLFDPLAKVIRINNDGSLDSGFTSNLATTIRDILIQSDGKVLVFADGNRLFRLNVDGTIDSSFSFSASVGGCFPAGEGISAAALQSDGKVLIGGCLKYRDEGFFASNLLRLNGDGSVDQSFNSVGNPVSGGFSVNNIVVQLDGKIIVVTEASEHIFGNSLYRLDRDGELDQSFDLDPHNLDLESSYRNVVLQKNGKILISGQFHTIAGVARRGMARLNADGTVDTSINPEILGRVDDMISQDNGKILVVGKIDSVGDILQTSNIVRLNQKGFPRQDYDLCFPIVADDRSTIVCL